MSFSAWVVRCGSLDEGVSDGEVVRGRSEGRDRSYLGSLEL